MKKKAEIVVTRWENETYTVSYKGVNSRMDVRLLLYAVEKDARKRKARGIPFSSTESTSPVPTGASKSSSA